MHVRGEYRREVCEADPDRIGVDGEHRQHDESGDDARHDEVCDRIVGQRLEGIDLLGDAHRPDFGRHLRADAAGEHEPGEERTQLENHHLPGDQADDRQLDAGEELIARLERQ